MKYVFEALSEQKRIPLSKVTWDQIEPKKDPNAPRWQWQKDTVDLPNNFQSSEQIKSMEGFERWYRDFTKRWGITGELVEIRPTYWNIEGNIKWDEAYERGSKAVSQYYDEKSKGGYSGD